MAADRAVVEETPVWLEVNGRPAVTWMCTPDQLEELVVGWLHGEGYITSVSDITKMRPCASDLGFWVDINPALVERVDAEGRKQVLASGCGAVSIFLSEPSSIPLARPTGEMPTLGRLRALFKELFQRGERYQSTGGIHAAALTDGDSLLHHAEDIGRHNAVDKVIGGAILAERVPSGLGLLVTGRISAELSFKAARAGLFFIATPSVPSTLALAIAQRAGMTLIGRAVSGVPHFHDPHHDASAERAGAAGGED